MNRYVFFNILNLTRSFISFYLWKYRFASKKTRKRKKIETKD